MIFPADHLTVTKTPVFPTNHLADTSKPANLTATKVTTQKPKQQFYKLLTYANKTTDYSLL